jgi:hypothetical protein
MSGGAQDLAAFLVEHEFGGGSGQDVHGLSVG